MAGLGDVFESKGGGGAAAPKPEAPRPPAQGGMAGR